MRCKMLVAAIFAAVLAPSAAFAAMLSSNFETDETANWTVNVGPAGAANDKANFFFDYGAIGIPAPPSSAGTRGLKLVGNLGGAVLSGPSVSPTGKNFGATYKLSFDWWSSFNVPGTGAASVGGSGSTQLSTFGIGTNGTSNQIPGLASSVWFAVTGDGNSSVDWRAYSSAATTGYTAPSGVFAAGTGTSPDARNQSHPYYASFGDVPPPAYAASLAPAPQTATGNSLVGSSAWEWHKVLIEKTATNVTWTVDGLLIATVPLSGLTLSGDNIFFGHADTNATASSDPNDEATIFTLIDNVSVVVPEPTSFLMCVLAALGLCVARRR